MLWFSLQILFEIFLILRTVLRYTTTNVQSVTLVTEPGISLIILTPMKILQRNLNRSTFVVWEMWRHHNMCWKWPPFASRQDWTRRAIFWKVLASTSVVTAWTINTLSSTVYRYTFQLSCVNPHITLTFNETTTVLCRHPQPNDRENSREARQAGNRLASWWTVAPCRNNQAHYRHTLQTHTLQTHSSSFLTQRTYSCSNFATISSLVLELLKKCRVRQRVEHPVVRSLCTVPLSLVRF